MIDKYQVFPINNSQATIINNEGQPIFLEDIEDMFTSHVDALNNYIQMKYGKSTTSSSIYNDQLEALTHFLVKQGNIVYLHSEGFGLLYFPQEITNESKTTIYNLFEKLDPKTKVYISSNTHSSNLTEQRYQSYSTNIKLLDKYFEIKQTERVKKI